MALCLAWPLFAEAAVRAELKKIDALNNTAYISLWDGKKPIVWEDLSVEHEYKIHGFLLDSELQAYEHVHLEPSVNPSQPGEYQFKLDSKILEEKKKNKLGYAIWLDFVYKTPYKIKLDLLKYKAPKNPEKNLPRKNTNLINKVGDLIFEIQFQDNLKLGIDNGFKLKITKITESGLHQALDPKTVLEPVMGAYAHVAGFYSNFKDMMHIHDANNLEFHVKPERAGFLKLFVLVKMNGKEITIPFGAYVLGPGSGVLEK